MPQACAPPKERTDDRPTRRSPKPPTLRRLLLLRGVHRRPPAKRLPVGPAIDAITATGITVSPTTRPPGINIYRAIRAGPVTVVTGDRIAASVGMHPVEIWDDWGHDDPADQPAT